jgi:hypothetical protein
MPPSFNLPQILESWLKRLKDAEESVQFASRERERSLREGDTCKVQQDLQRRSTKNRRASTHSPKRARQE